MGRGRREKIYENKLNIKKVILVIVIVLLIIIGIICAINKDKIIEMFSNENKEEYVLEQQDKQNQPEETVKTVEDILTEFGGEVIEQPKSDTYYVLKDKKEYTIYADGEIIEEKVSIWNGKSSKPTLDEKAKTIKILTPEELKWVADQVINGEENFSGFTITLQKNLDFGARIKEDGTWEGPVWTSVIGFLDELSKDDKAKKETDETEVDKEKLKRFAGTFNGNGFSIRGIFVDSDKNYQGLFGYSTGIIQNVILKDSYISGNTGTGAIVGLNGGTVSNCVTKNTIVNGKASKVGGIIGISMSESNISLSHTENGEVKGKQYIAGIAGYINNNVTIKDCSNSAKITGEEYVGGISGIAFFGTVIQSTNNHGKINGKNYTGGIVGYSEAQLEMVYNKEEVIGEDFVAGIVGANVTVGTISKSYNKANIIGNNNVGGIVGTNNASTSNCYNTGNIKAEGYRAGGICGQNATDSFVQNSYNIGNVDAKDSIGGIVGGNFGTINNSYYLNTILKKVESEQSKTEEEMKNNIIENLGEEFSIDTKNINNGYLVLKWEL